MRRHRMPVMLAGLLFACGGSSSTDTATVPEPVAVSPEVAAGAAEPEPPEPLLPPDEAEGEPVEGTIRMRGVFGAGGTGSVFAAAGNPVGWWIAVRDPGGAEQRYPPDSLEVAGWRCQLQRASVQHNVQLNRGTRTTSHRAERTLVCEKDGQRRSATAICGYDEDPSGRTAVVTPAELDVGDPQDPHRVILGCDPPSP